MKKLLSLLLVLSLCLSSVILLASCTGKSAYDIAVENGFEGDEKAWLESLKGPQGEAGNAGEAGEEGEEGYPGLPGDAGLSPFEDLQINHNYLKTVQEWLASLKGTDGRDGHNVVVSVNENGYWVIDGTPQPVKVDGTKKAVASIKLVQNVYSVVKSGTAPKLEILCTYDDDSTATLPVSNDVIANASYDLTKEGVYPVSISYGGVTATDTITVEGLMVYFENFDSLSDTATMAEICAQAGFQIPVPHLEHSYTVPTVNEDGTTSTEKTKYSDLYAQGMETWFLDGSDLTPYIVYGGLHRGNFVELKVQSGKLVYNTHTNNGKMAGSTDSFLIIANDEEMNFAAQDTYTIQMDIKFPQGTDAGTPDDTADDVYTSSIHPTSMGSTLALLAKFTDEGASKTGTSAGRPISVCAAFGNQYLMANVVRVSSWYLGTSALDATGLEKSADQSANVLTTLFPDSTSDTWFGEEITVRFVITGKNADNPGYTVYMKKASDGEDKFVKVGDFNVGLTTEKGFNAFMKDDSDGFAIQTRSLQKYAAFYVDNIAAWTGNGNMPTNTSTATYEALNQAYNASLTPAA